MTTSETFYRTRSLASVCACITAAPSHCSVCVCVRTLSICVVEWLWCGGPAVAALQTFLYILYTCTIDKQNICYTMNYARNYCPKIYIYICDDVMQWDCVLSINDIQPTQKKKKKLPFTEYWEFLRKMFITLSMLALSIWKTSTSHGKISMVRSLFMTVKKKKNVLFYATAGRAFTMWCMVWSWCWLFFIQPYLAFVCWRRRLSRFVPYLAKSPHLHH